MLRVLRGVTGCYAVLLGVTEHLTACFREYQDGGADEEDGGRARGPGLSVRESLAAEDGNVAAKVANVTSNVVGKVGNKVSKDTESALHAEPHGREDRGVFR